MSIPLQSRNDMVSIEPLSLKIVPEGETEMGSAFRESPTNGSLIEITRIEPRLVPTQSVGHTE